jgi:folate-dependent phosphoribosylglycinamide formyltransferase PurN
MKIIICTPEEHFHTPLILRALGQWKTAHEITVFTTPKLGSKDSFWLNIKRWIKQSGFDYIFSLAFMKLLYRGLGFIERSIRTIPFAQRQYLTVPEVIKQFNYKWHRVQDINTPATIDLFKALQPDIILVLFFNQIIKAPLLTLPRLGCINLHPSYLPVYRGVSPCFWVLVNNENTTGISLHYLEAGIDSGAILGRAKTPIQPTDTFFSLYRRCALLGIPLLNAFLDKLSSGQLPAAIPQDTTQSSYYGSITPAAVRRFRKNKRVFGWII